jgi:hypothetical protein
MGDSFNRPNGTENAVDRRFYRDLPAEVTLA